MSRQLAGPIGKIGFVWTGSADDAAAFERALRLSERAQAELSIVAAVEMPSPGLLRILTSWGAAPEALSSEAELTAEVQRLVDTATRRNVQAAGTVLRGPSPVVEVIRHAVRDRHDLLVKTAEPSLAVRRVLFGHVDRQLIRKCPCPVWIDKPSGRASYDRVLAAVDPSPFRDDPDFDPAREELNQEILRVAGELAHAESAELHVVHVWPFDLEAALESRAGLAHEVVVQMAGSIKQKHEQALAELVGPWLPHIARVHLLKGRARDEIPRLAANEMMDVVVMGTVCRTGVSGMLIGNTAETVLDQVDCAVVALKPRGFVSPVGV
jgi:universal stress protein E